MYWSSNVPPYTQHSLIQSQIWFRSGRARFSGFTICSFPYNVVGLCNPLKWIMYSTFHPQLSFGSKRARFCSEQAEMCNMTTRSSKFFWFNSCGIHLEYFHTNPIFRIWSEMVCWAELSLSAISDVVKKGSCSNIALTTSSSIKDGRPKRGLSERSKSPVSNFSYHLLHVLSETVPIHIY